MNLLLVLVIGFAIAFVSWAIIWQVVARAWKFLMWFERAHPKITLAIFIALLCLFFYAWGHGGHL